MKTLKQVGIAILAVVLVVVCTYTAIQWDAIVAGWTKDAEREVFKETVTYNEAAASFLADAYKEYNNAETEKDQTAIMEYVVMRYPNLDYSNIDNQDLKEFYIECINN